MRDAQGWQTSLNPAPPPSPDIEDFLGQFYNQPARLTIPAGLLLFFRPWVLISMLFITVFERKRLRQMVWGHSHPHL